MISITQDSEFMVNLLPANPIPAGKRFKTFQDQNANPAVVSLGEDSVLNLIINENVTATQLAPVRKDLGQICKFSGTVRAFDLLQNPDDSLCIVVATDAGNNLSNLYIVNNVMPANLLEPNPNQILFAGSSFPVVYDIFLSNFSQTVAQTVFPMMFLALAPPGSVTKSSQLGFLNISARDGGGFSFSLDTSWRLATDPIQIMSVAFGTCPLGSGAFVLYTASDGSHLQFCTFQGTGFVSEMECPNGALYIDSFINPATKYSELIVGGDVITKFTYSQYCAGGGTGTPIATGSTSLGIKDIYVLQAQDNITIWYTSVANGVFYYSAPIATPDAGELIQLLEEGTGGQLSPMIILEDPSSGLLANTLVSVDGTGALTLLQNTSDTGMWQTVPFFVPSDSNNMEIPSFTLRFKAMSDNPDQPVAACQLHLKTSGSVKAFSNGGSVIIDQAGRWYQADDDGVVSIIVQTDDMASFTFQVDQYRTPDQITTLPVQSLVLNPNNKINVKMTAIKTGKDLLNAKTQSGDSLIPAGTVSSDIADQAAGMITELNKLQLVRGQPTDQLIRFPPNRRSVYNPHNEIPEIVAGQLPHDKAEREAFMKAISLSGLRDIWGIWRWIKEKVKAATSWVLTKIGQAWDFVVKIGDQIYKFAMDTVEAIGKALTWVFQKISVGLKKLIDYLGFIFSWGDILATSDSIVALLNASLSYGADQIAGLKAQKTAFMNKLRDSIGARVAPETTAAGSEMKDPNQTSSMDNTQNSVAYNWTSYQVSYSGMGINGSITNAVEALQSPNDGPTIEDLWTDVSNIFQSVEHLVNNIAKDVQDLFTPSTTTTDVWNRLSDDLIRGALDTINNVADFLLDALSLILTSFQELGNKPIQLPIFSSLWKLIAGSRPFTVFNALALILAIPATIIYKVVLNKAPPSLASFTKADFAAYLSGTTTENAMGVKRSDIVLVLGATALVALRLQTDFQALSFIYKTATGLKAETLDTCMIVVGSLLQIVAWPVQSPHNMDLKWVVWFLDSSNVLALALGRFAGWKMGTSRVDTAPLVGIWSALNSIPSFVLRILIHIDDDAGKPGLMTRHIIEDTFTMLKSWLDAIKEIIKDLKAKAIAQAAGYLCLGLKLILKFVDFWIDAEPGFRNRTLLLALEFNTGRNGVYLIANGNGKRQKLLPVAPARTTRASKAKDNATAKEFEDVKEKTKY